MAREYKDLFLIQRLEKPERPRPLGPNPFNFGGGGSGLSKEAFDLLKGVWSFAHMGWAEFEFGAIPRALDKLVNMDLDAMAIDIPWKAVKKPTQWKNEPPIATMPGSFPVFVICPKGDVEKVKETIILVAGEKQELKESSQFYLAAYQRPNIKAVGWLAFDPPFMFFTDEEMFQKAKRLFVDKEDPHAQAG